ncbi:MAG TPA: DUF5615 family PIN-like protein [Chloroflexota bacterium]
MAAFYLDNDVSVDLADLLRAEGHAVYVTRDLGAAAHNDAQQLLSATTTYKALLVTHNYKDFLLLNRAWLLWSAHWQQTEAHAAILVLEQADEAALARHIADFVGLGWPLENALYRYRASTHWVLCR